MNRANVDTHPPRVQRERHHLPFDYRAYVAGPVTGLEAIAADAWNRDARSDFGLVPRQQNPAVVPRAGRRERLRELVPRQSERVAHLLACERSVLENCPPHIGAGRRGEHVSRPARIDSGLAHEAEDGIARSKRNRDDALRDETGADEAAGVVARP